MQIKTKRQRDGWIVLTRCGVMLRALQRGEMAATMEESGRVRWAAYDTRCAALFGAEAMGGCRHA